MLDEDLGGRVHLSEETRRLAVRIAARQRSYYEDVKRYGRRSLQTRLAIMSLGALITLLLGLKVTPGWNEHIAPALALVASTVVTILSAVETLSAHGARFVNTETARRALRNLLDELDILTADADLTPDQRRDIFLRFQKAVADADAGAVQAREVYRQGPERRA
jgi:hypothetical protein